MVEPAMTADEWEGGEKAWPTVALETTKGGSVSVWDGKLSDDSQHVRVAEGDRHALAALCLYRQHYGFTREDVQAIRVLMEGIPGDWGAIPKGTMDAWDKAQQLAPDLAERIAALLPPEE